MTVEPELLTTITISSRATMDRDLDTAVHAAVQRAIHDGRRGIRVTQIDHSSYTIELTHEVPYGHTDEKRKG